MNLSKSRKYSLFLFSMINETDQFSSLAAVRVGSFIKFGQNACSIKKKKPQKSITLYKSSWSEARCHCSIFRNIDRKLTRKTNADTNQEIERKMDKHRPTSDDKDRQTDMHQINTHRTRKDSQWCYQYWSIEVQESQE